MRNLGWKKKNPQAKLFWDSNLQNDPSTPQSGLHWAKLGSWRTTNRVRATLLIPKIFQILGTAKESVVQGFALGIPVCKG